MRYIRDYMRCGQFFYLGLLVITLKILHNESITISLFSKALKTGDLKCIKIFCPHWSSSDASILQPQHLLSGLPIFKNTWPQGGLCDRKTSPPCTRLLSRCEPSPCFASVILRSVVTNESCEIINVMLFSFFPNVRGLT